MYLQRLLQINMATLAASGALLLGMGRRNPAIPLLVLLAAIASIWLTDITGWFRLNRTVGSLAALVAAAIAFRQWYFGDELIILAIANLLLYLQIILLFEEKDGKVYWLLAGVSLLQVVAATAFSQGVWFGLMLVIYMLVALSALALLLLYRQWNRYRAAGQVPPPASLGDRRWPLAGQRTTFTTTPAGHSRAGLGWSLFGRLGRIGLGTVTLTVLMFVALPRLGGTAWRGAAPNPTRVVGFDPEVTLGELGETIDSRDEVMRVRFLDNAGLPYPVKGEIYLYGATLAEYSEGHWKAPISSLSRFRLAKDRSLPRDEPLPPGFVRQRCKIEPLDRDELFYVTPVVAVRGDPSIRVEGDRARLTRASHYRGRRLTYELGTTAIVGGVQQPLVPNVKIASTDKARQLPSTDLPDNLPELVALADSWVAESGKPLEDRVGRARYLEQEFKKPGRFQYSLEGQDRDLSIDPIEDFISNNPRGHCEYFATALTLMLRSQQIPARMVVGYKCDEFNELGGFHQVRQSHAHTWVEAYLEPEHLEDLHDLHPEYFHGKDHWDWSYGGWLRLDPTPAAGEAEAGGIFAAILDRAKKAVDWLETRWTNYVVEMDRQRQREAIYRPVVRAAREAIRNLRDPEWWRGLLEKIGWALDLTEGGTGFWLRLVLLLPTGLLVLVFAARWLRRLLPRLWARLARWAIPAAGKDHPRVEWHVL